MIVTGFVVSVRTSVLRSLGQRVDDRECRVEAEDVRQNDRRTVQVDHRRPVHVRRLPESSETRAIVVSELHHKAGGRYRQGLSILNRAHRSGSEAQRLAARDDRARRVDHDPNLVALTRRDGADRSSRREGRRLGSSARPQEVLGQWVGKGAGPKVAAGVSRR